MAVGIQLTVVGLATVAYTSIFRIVLRQRQLSKRLSRRTNSESRILKVASTIIITYIVLETVPSVVLSALFKCRPNVAKDYRRLLQIPSAFNTMGDPIVYIYNYPPLKAALKRKLKQMINKSGMNQQRCSNTVEPTPDRYNIVITKMTSAAL